MSTLKTKLMALGLCLVLVLSSVPVTSLAEGDDNELLLSALEDKEVVNFKTTMVTKGNYVETSTQKANLIFPNSTYVFNTFTVGSPQFRRFIARRGTWIEKGDPIAELSVSVDESYLEELQVKIEREKLNLDAYMTEQQAFLDECLRIVNSAPSAKERELAKLEYDRAKSEYDKEKDKRSKSISSMESEYETQLSVGESYIVTAPQSGIISDFAYIDVGKKMRGWDYIATIVNTDEIRIEVYGAGDKLRYNMPVVIFQGSGAEAVEVPGRCVTCSSKSLSSGLGSNIAVIEAQGDMSALNLNKDISIRYQQIVMENVLLVSTKAINKDNKGTYVNLLKDGRNSKRYVVIGATNSQYTWVVQGLEEGDLVVLK